MSIATFFLITALVLLAIGSIWSAVTSSRALALAKANGEQIKELHNSTNSRLDALLQVTGAHQRSLGIEEGRKQQKALDEKAR